jgi:predicted CXXCH cytochrome family protein
MAKASFKHDPAANGDCASCHNPHQSNEKALLLKNPSQLCFDCHEEKDMAGVKAHAGTTGKSCLECHDPHWGKDKYLLKPAAAKASARPTGK